MTIDSQKDIDGLTEIGKIVALTISEMKRHTRIGITTKELDDIGETFLNSCGAVSAPKQPKIFRATLVSALTAKLLMGYRGIEKFSRATL